MNSVKLSQFSGAASCGFPLELDYTPELSVLEQQAADLLGTVFGLGSCPVVDSTALADFSGSAVRNASGPNWAQAVRDRVYAVYGVNCDVHECLIDVLRRIQKFSPAARA